MQPKLCFLGFGEAAFHIASGLHAQAEITLTAYVRSLGVPAKQTAIMERATAAGVFVTHDIAAALSGSDFVLSLVNASSALAVAREALPLMREQQVFIDLNSTSPKVKQQVKEAANGRVPVVDGAILGPVPLYGHRIPMVLSGQGCDQFTRAMKPFGMDITVLHAEVGAASTMKMLRSVFMKGYPQLLLECMIPAYRYGILEEVIDSLEKTIGGKTLRQVATQTFGATVLHAKRRATEMQEVIATLDELGEQHDIALATRDRLERLALCSKTIHPEEYAPDYKKILKQLLETEHSAKSSE